MSEYRHIDHGFDPVFDNRSRVLVLGSFPSVLSRQNSFYYGNPRNRFWQVMAACIGCAAPPNQPVDESIARKTQMLQDAGIALWDVIQSCDIKGSSDSSIRNVVPVRLERVLLAANVQAVIANGRTAEALYHRYLQPNCTLPLTGLPSTSPANAAWTMDRLVPVWREALAPYLRTDGAIPQP